MRTGLESRVITSGSGRRTLPAGLTLLISLLTFGLLVPAARAQYTNNFQTNTISGVLSNWVGNGFYFVGSNTFSDVLQINSSGVLSNGSGLLGYNSNASNNTAFVNGPGSIWKSRTNLYIGFFTPGNQLILTNGGRAFDAAGTIGYTNANGNSALITGPGSVWSNSSFLYVGYNGSANRLIVTNQGAAWSGDSYVGEAKLGSNNLASIIGTGSVWSTTNTLNVGFLGSSNSLFILDGGVANALSTDIGVDPFSSNNVVTISGSGALLSNTFNVFMGVEGPGNRMVVSNGAAALDNVVVVGLTNTSTRNVAIVDGSGSMWSNAVRSYVGYMGSFNQLIVANGGNVFSGIGYIGWDGISSNNSVFVGGAGSTWTVTNNVFVGFVGSSNRLTMADGANVSDFECRIGFDPLSSNNVATITGPGTVLSNKGSTVVGYGGFSSRLIISNGAAVYSDGGIVGYTNQSSRNTAVITGAGSVWDNGTNTYVGYKSVGNQLFVMDAGEVTSLEGRIGEFVFASNNVATVDGGIWNTGDGLYVGDDGRSNKLIVANGGTVNSLSVFTSVGAGASNNVVIVSGAGSVLSNTFSTGIGYRGSFNQMLITNGGGVFNEDGEIGYTNTAARNTVIVDGVGSVWTNWEYLFVGYQGFQSQLIVTNGGTVFSGQGFIGTFPQSSNNTVTVTGPGSLWQNTNLLYVGQEGDRNTLIITNGGEVDDRGGVIGKEAGSVSNTVIVSGVGSVWSNQASVDVGGQGSFNTMIITNGGKVIALLAGFVGSAGTTSNNSVTVTGTGSLWTNVVDTDVLNGRLTVVNGGKVVCNQGIVGESNSSNAVAVVAGSGSAWINNTSSFSSMYVGLGAPLGTLIVSNGGALYSGNGYVGNGSFALSDNNSATITGAGSIWSNRYAFTVGLYATHCSLIVSNGASLVDSNASLGDGGSNIGTNNTAVITGAGSVWKTDASLTIGAGGGSNRLTVAAGGLVLAGNLNINPSTFSNQVILAGGTVQVGSISIPAGNSLSGLGTVSAGTLQNSGTLNANVNGATLTFNGVVKNTGTMRTTGTGIMEFFGPVLNFGTTNFVGGSVIIHGPFFSSQGNTNSWNFAGDGQWEQAARWSLGVPSSTNAVVSITNATSKTVLVSSNTFSAAPGSVTNLNVLVSGPAGTTNTLRIADLAPGQMFVPINMTVNSNAVMVVSNATVHAGLLGSGTFSLNGTMRIQNGGFLDLSDLTTFITGTSGGALLSVEGGSVLSDTATLGFGGQAATAVVSGVTATWTNSVLALGARACVILTNGGQMASGQFVSMSGLNATILLTGTGTTWRINATNNASTINIGFVSAGGDQLIVSNGAVVRCDIVNVNLFGEPNDQIIVGGGGAQFFSSRGITCGSFSSGNCGISVGAGGTMTTAYLLLANAQVGTNFVNVTGGALYVTNGLGTGQLELRNPMTLNTGTVTIDDLFMSTNNGVGWINFLSGTMNVNHAEVTNFVPFVVGDGTNAANYHLLGGVNLFNAGFEVRSNAVVSGCGTLNATVVIDAGGTALSDCGTLSFVGSVTNNGTMRAINGSTLESFGPVVNNGVIDLINGGLTNFPGGFINNGVVLDASSVQAAQSFISGSDFVVEIQSLPGHTYQLQSANSLPSLWPDLGAPQAGNGGLLIFMDTGGATNSAQFYRIHVTAP